MKLNLHSNRLLQIRGSIRRRWQTRKKLHQLKSSNKGSAAAESLVSKMNDLAVFSKPVTASTQSADVSAQGQDIGKKVRALKKKVSVTFSHTKTRICLPRKDALSICIHLVLS